MDFTNIKCINESCKDKKITMIGAGAQLSGRVDLVKVKCPKCRLTLMIVPMDDKYEITISATTREERVEKNLDWS